MAAAPAGLLIPSRSAAASAAPVEDATLPPPPVLAAAPAAPADGCVPVSVEDGRVVVHPVGTAALNAFDTALADALACLAEAHTRLDGPADDTPDGRMTAAAVAVGAALGAVRAVAGHDLVARPFGAVVVLAGCDGLLSGLLDRLTAPAPAVEPEALPELVAERFGLGLTEVG